MRRGAEGAAVRSLQVLLNVHMGSNIPPDGIYGARTEAAVQHAQRRLKLGVTGVADRETLTAVAAFRTAHPVEGEVFPW